MTDSTNAVDSAQTAETEATIIPLPIDHRQPTDIPDSITSPDIDRACDQVDELLRLADEANADFTSDEFTAADLDVPTGFLLSVVIPVFNERDSVRTIVGKIMALPVETEIIIVDDGSTDGTQQVLSELAQLPHVHVVLKRQNEGKGAALRSGFSMTQGDIVVVQDADLEYDPRDIPSLLRPIVDGYADVVYGSRFLEQRHRGSSFTHRFGNRMLTMISNLANGLHLTDMETCYKVIRRDALDQIPLTQNRFGIEPEITAKIARREMRIVEMPIHYNARNWKEGKKIGIKDAFAALYCIFRYSIAD